MGEGEKRGRGEEGKGRMGELMKYPLIRLKNHYDNFANYLIIFLIKFVINISCNIAAL
jgi:hypothetical protein